MSERSEYLRTNLLRLLCVGAVTEFVDKHVTGHQHFTGARAIAERDSSDDNDSLPTGRIIVLTDDDGQAYEVNVTVKALSDAQVLTYNPILAPREGESYAHVSPAEVMRALNNHGIFPVGRESKAIANTLNSGGDFTYTYPLPGIDSVNLTLHFARDGFTLFVNRTEEEE